MGRGGFVLVAALWLLVALSAVGLDAALRSQAQRLAAGSQLDAARAREAALAGSEYARARLTAAALDHEDELRAEIARRAGGTRFVPRFSGAAVGDPWREPAELMPPGMVLGDAEFLLDASDTGLRLNINTASEDMLRQFFAHGLRIDYAWADRVTQAILDWRDEDDLPRLNGAEREQYVEAGAAVLPPNRPFTDVAELRHVMGMTPALYAAARPFLTATGSGRINVNAAPEPVLLAVPTFTPAVAAELLRRRDAGQFPRSGTELRALLGPIYEAPAGAALADLNRRVTYATNEVEIMAVGRTGGSAVTATVRSIVARAEGGAVMVWRRIE
jgi:general secretion pathway protein K